MQRIIILRRGSAEIPTVEIAPAQPGGCKLLRPVVAEELPTVWAEPAPTSDEGPRLLPVSETVPEAFRPGPAFMAAVANNGCQHGSDRIRKRMRFKV